MRIYNDQGYLNISEIAKAPAWLIVIIGARQVGKTYGTLKYMLDNDIRHILLRRTSEELELIGSSLELNPYKPFEPDYQTGIFKKNKLYQIADYKIEDEKKPVIEKSRGLALSLAQISHIRGFNGSSYTDIVYDEFIPEKGVTVRRSEGDSLLNAYTTINGNRELKGQPPARLWLLANSNNINSPVLEALNLTDRVLEQRRKGQEWSQEGGVLLIQPKSRNIIDQRKKTALMDHLGEGGNFAEMALNNEFAYDRSPLLKQFNLKGLQPLFSYNDLFYAWEGKGFIYICRAKHKKDPYAGNDYSRQQLANVSSSHSHK